METASFAAAARPTRPQGVVEVGREHVEVSGLSPPPQPGFLRLDDQTDRPGHRGGERLSSAHPAGSRGQEDPAFKRTPEVLFRAGN